MWRNVFLPHAENLTKNIVGIEIAFDVNKKRELYQAYQENRNKFRENKRDQANLIDRHKIASALVHSILTVAPYPLFSGPDYTYAQRCANEIFALYISLQVLRNFNMTIAKDETSRVIFQHKYIFPETSNGEDYTNHLIKTFRQIRINGEDSLSALAHCFFFIEKFHIEKSKQKLRQDIQ